MNTDRFFGGRTYNAQTKKLETAAAVDLHYYMGGAEDATELYFINRAWEEQVRLPQSDPTAHDVHRIRTAHAQHQHTHGSRAG